MQSYSKFKRDYSAKKNQVLGNNNHNTQSTIEEHISYLEKLKQKTIEGNNST